MVSGLLKMTTIMCYSLSYNPIIQIMLLNTTVYLCVSVSNI